MQRYFCNLCENDEYLLSSDDSYHIKKVMRMKKNEQIEIVCNMKTYLCEIVSLEPVKARKIREILENHENTRKIILVQSLINENKMDFVLQKGTELGVSMFYPTY